MIKTLKPASEKEINPLILTNPLQLALGATYSDYNQKAEGLLVLGV